ncbi:alpha-galactosidase [Paenibacillus gansuensis]|uniref:Alpha-galactosidase n=1 Tax=Paenibacillus gansuensis TaxID=306542 RepID=A0ABW5PHM9_9BACL
MNTLSIENAKMRLTFGSAASSFLEYTVSSSGRTYQLGVPVFQIDGKQQVLVPTNLRLSGDPVKLRNGSTEHRITAEAHTGNAEYTLQLTVRVTPGSPVVRFKYALAGASFHHLTKTDGADDLTYFTYSLSDLPQAKEVRFSEFIDMVHSYCLSELQLADRDFTNDRSVMGPMLVAGDDSHTLLTAYEHGSQVPDAFLEYRLDGDRNVRLSAVKGNYLTGQSLHTPFETVWFQIAAIEGDEDELAREYRAFMLNGMSENTESRKPYIFYNTWNLQERTKHWYKGKFLDAMHQDRVMEEIERAHRLGVEVFVIDAGWFEKTGDWIVNRERFPGGLKSIKAKLDEYGMKLGLWFEPTSAALSSNMAHKHLDAVMGRDGAKVPPRPVWETEESYYMCLVSGYAESFADELIRLVKEVGVTYFKWDWISQYGCDDPNHWHGDETHSREERKQYYAFMMGRYMSNIVDKLCAECPEAIVDFDVTEGERYVGLGFLSSGKYFLINNGPYYQNYDLPGDLNDGNGNIFFYPGPARGWITRTPLNLDKWIPSVLYLTHYFPDDRHQLTSIATLVLGHNGIWGDLSVVSDEGITHMRRWLDLYKQVRGDITASTIKLTGTVGGSPEIYEKINPHTGRGVVSLFAGSPGRYSFVTEYPVDRSFAASEGAEVSFDAEGHAKIDVTFNETGARMVLFGVTE